MWPSHKTSEITLVTVSYGIKVVLVTESVGVSYVAEILVRVGFGQNTVPVSPKFSVRKFAFRTLFWGFSLWSLSVTGSSHSRDKLVPKICKFFGIYVLAGPKTITAPSQSESRIKFPKFVTKIIGNIARTTLKGIGGGSGIASLFEFSKSFCVRSFAIKISETKTTATPILTLQFESSTNTPAT